MSPSKNPDSDWMDIDDIADADVDDELQVDDDSKDQIFQSFPDPDDPDFDLLFQSIHLSYCPSTSNS